MTLTEFEHLSLSEQMDLLHQDGVYIGKKKSIEGTYILYQYNNFYVEIYYTDYRITVDGLRCFTSPEDLEPYLG